MKTLKNFKEFTILNESSTLPNTFPIGDLVWDKEAGQNGLIGLVVGNTTKDDDGDEVCDVLYRDMNGEVYSTMTDGLEEVDYEHIPDAVNNADISMYKSIASKRGITLNPKYEIMEDDYLNDDTDFDIEDEYPTDL